MNTLPTGMGDGKESAGPPSTRIDFDARQWVQAFKAAA